MNENISESRYDDEEDEDIELSEDYGMILKKFDSNKLWARAVAKCSICKCDLFKQKHSDTNIGVECHICSEKPDIPSKDFSRYDPNLSSEKRDKSYNNAILLCRNCHAIIDDPKNTQYTIEELQRIKEKHEADVKTGQENNKEAEHEDEKTRISGTLLTEIKANQNKLQPISDIVDELVNDCKECSEEGIALPNILRFNTNYFKSLSGKLELLTDNSRAKLFLYYSELESIEEEYKDLKSIHGETCTSLVILQFKEATKTKIFKPGWNEIAKFLERTKKTYDLGEELIKCLIE